MLRLLSLIVFCWDSTICTTFHQLLCQFHPMARGYKQSRLIEKPHIMQRLYFGRGAVKLHLFMSTWCHFSFVLAPSVQNSVTMHWYTSKSLLFRFYSAKHSSIFSKIGMVWISALLRYFLMEMNKLNIDISEDSNI